MPKKKWGEYDLYTRQNYNINFSTYSERVVGFKTWKESFLGLNYWSTYFIFSLMQSKYLFALCKEMGRELVVRKHILQNVGEISKIIFKTTRRNSNLKNKNNFIFIVLFLIIPWKLWQSLNSLLVETLSIIVTVYQNKKKRYIIQNLIIFSISYVIYNVFKKKCSEYWINYDL